MLRLELPELQNKRAGSAFSCGSARISGAHTPSSSETQPVTASRTDDFLGLAGKVLAHGARSALSPKPTRGVPRGDTRFVPPPPQSPPQGSGDEAEANDGWGFADTKFVVRPNGSVVLTGKRYNISDVELPSLVPWMAKTLAAPLSYENRHDPHYPPPVPEARKAPELMSDLLGFLDADQLS